MKNIIATVVLSAVMVAALAYGMSKSMDNRCDYYMSQTHPTTQEISLCK